MVVKVTASLRVNGRTRILNESRTSRRTGMMDIWCIPKRKRRDAETEVVKL